MGLKDWGAPPSPGGNQWLLPQRDQRRVPLRYPQHRQPDYRLPSVKRPVATTNVSSILRLKSMSRVERRWRCIPAPSSDAESDVILSAECSVVMVQCILCTCCRRHTRAESFGSFSRLIVFD